MKPADVRSLRVLRRARDRIDRDYAEPIGIPALAAGGYSREHFIRAFRAAYGETPGFTSVGTFSTRFAELTGLSPTAYRQEAARRGGPAPIPGCFALMWRSGRPAPREANTCGPNAAGRCSGPTVEKARTTDRSASMKIVRGSARPGGDRRRV